MYRGEALYLALISLWTCVCASYASTPLVAWSNRDVFSQVSAEDVLHTASFISLIHKDLHFVIVFTTEKLDFDDIARYGGLYGDANNAPLAPLQVAVTTAGSSVWGETDRPEILINGLSYCTVAHYVTELTVSRLFEVINDSLKLLIVELPSGRNREKTLTEHGLKIAEVMKTVGGLNADYAAFYTGVPVQERERHSRAAPSLSDDERGNASASICSASAIISERVNSTRTYCSLLCIYETLYNYNTTDPDSKPGPLLGVVWPSWLGLSTQVDTDGNYNGTVCTMYSFKFDSNSGFCNTSTIESERFLNITSSTSITAHMNGTCSVAGKNETPLRLKVEFIFFSGAIKKKSGSFVRLPGNQLLLPGYWTMQLFVTNITNGSSEGDAVYMTQFKQDLDRVSANDGRATERRGLFYPFAIPSHSSYSCRSHLSHLFLPHGNPNRFVPTSTDYLNATEGPVLQFVGFHVEAFGSIYGAHPNTTLLSFSSVYDCHGYFDISSWTGTFVVLIVTIVLYLATLAIFSTKAVDRFDDPRGRTISVENLH